MKEALSRINNQRQVRQVWREQDAETLSRSIIGEAGELLEAITNGMPAIEVASEIGDVLWLTLALCGELGIDPKNAIDLKIKRNDYKYNPAVMNESQEPVVLSKTVWKDMGGDKMFYQIYLDYLADD